jgi:Domain of unknown function (DUF4177)
MQRWEYRVISLRDGRYTSALNEYGDEGWELISVVHDPPQPEATGGRGGIPMPGTLGRLEDTASKLTKLGESDAVDAPPSTLLWVLRRPLLDE